MKKTAPQRFVYKINSMRLRNTNWNLNITMDEAIRNEELIPIAENQNFNFIDIENNLDTNNVYKTVNEIENQIKEIKKLPTNIDNRRSIKLLYKMKFNNLLIKDYVCIVMDNNTDFNRLNKKKGFFINGIKFKKLLGTTGGIKNSVIVYVSERIYDNINKKIDNGRDLNKKFIPAKLEAYKALTCSASVPVSMPKGVLVVKDCITKFKSNIIKIDDTQSEEPIITYENDYDIELADSDGYGLILPSLSKKWTEELGENYISSGFCIRNSFCKGMLFTFDYIDFAKRINKQGYIVKDIWGNNIDVRDVEIILTESMLKLWDSYNSIEHYLRCCEENRYTFRVTKNTPKYLENQRETNYQFLQSLYLTSDMIDELIKPTVSELQDILGGDYRKSILFLKGIYLDKINFDSEDCDFTKALMIDKNMINDPYVRNKIHNMINKKIIEAKIGKLKVRANYSIISGDPYSLCQSIFGLEVTGLLKSGEFYSNYWNRLNVNKVACFRAPMTCHNNIRVLNLINTKEMNYWYKYMKTVTIFNSWDTTAFALNGADKDSDSIFTTDNKIILDGIKPTDAIMCVQKTAEKIIPTIYDLNKSNKDGFGDEIGITTNNITPMFDVLTDFDENSDEYKEIMYRIMCGQNYQQNAIDKIKGIVAKSMPKYWYNNKFNKIEENDDSEIVKKKTFNQKIVADKKPYFFKYIYPKRMKEYSDFISKSNKNCIMRFGITISELQCKENKTEEEINFLKWYDIKMPLSIKPSVMNQICWKIENIFDNYKVTETLNNFDYKILMTDKKYSKGRYDAIKKLYIVYNNKIKEQSQIYNTNKVNKEEKKIFRQVFIEQFKCRAYELCNDAEELCNIVVELCYKNNNSKQFAWDICGDIIINNLLKNNNYKISYPVLDKNGDIEFGGEKFTMITKEVYNEINFK